MVKDRFPGKVCVLCGQPSHGVGEHVWPSWLIGAFGGEGPFAVERNGTPVQNRDGQTVTFSSVQGFHVPMCAACNSNLGNDIEAPAKEPVCAIIDAASANGPWPKLDAVALTSIARLFIKIAVLKDHPDGSYDAPHLQRGAVAASSFNAQWVDWLRNRTAPPDDFYVFVTRVPARLQPNATAQGSEVFLPDLIVDGETVECSAWSIGVRGVQADVVWVPGWQVDHLALPAGRAAQLWPRPTQLDASTLPELVAPELRFICRGLGGYASVSRSTYDRLRKMPLSVERDARTMFSEITLNP